MTFRPFFINVSCRRHSSPDERPRLPLPSMYSPHYDTRTDLQASTGSGLPTDLMEVIALLLPCYTTSFILLRLFTSFGKQSVPCRIILLLGLRHYAGQRAQNNE